MNLFLHSQISCTFEKMATCIFNISLGDNSDISRQQPIISSTEFSWDEFFNADTRRFFFDSNDTEIDQESVLQKIMHKLRIDATNKLQDESRTSLDLRIKDENFCFTYIDEDGDNCHLSICGGIIDVFD